MTKRLFENDPAPVHDRNDAARLFVLPHLELYPLRDVVEGGLQPFDHDRVSPISFAAFSAKASRYAQRMETLSV